MDFLWHKVSEKEKEDIKKEAKSILDSFSKKLGKVKGKLEDSHVEREESERQEGNEKRDFSRDIMFDNAPKKSEDFILGEKGGW
ncbi:MAG: hypothetical protein WDZ69_02595 [Candidatus Pacearchaeota archaeon]